MLNTSTIILIILTSRIMSKEKKDKKSVKNGILKLRIQDELLNTIKVQADVNNVSVSKYVRESVIDRIAKSLR